MIGSNLLWKTTFEDSQSIRSPKHPKYLYIECLSNNPYIRHYAAQQDLSVEDMAMLACKDLGCLVNYCGLLKRSVPSEWKESSDCVDEYQQFSECMKMEQKRWNWMPKEVKEKTVKYDYIMNRMQERRHVAHFAMDQVQKLEARPIEPKEVPQEQENPLSQ